MADNPDQQQAANPAAAAAASGLRLPQFWTDAPNSWFSMAEAQFHLRGVVNNADKYCHLLAALPREAFRMVAHIVERDQEAEAAEEDLYAQLKAALVSSHVQSNYRRIELLSTVEPLGGRRLSELLASMLELCPSREEASPFFCYLFLQRLPREIRVLLADEDAANMRAVAEKADRLMVLHKPQSHEVGVAAVASLSDEEEAVAAVAGGNRRCAAHKKKKAKKGGSSSNNSGGDKQGLCYFHNKFGERAHRCEEPCSWPENE
jgi:hypothetical protein